MARNSNKVIRFARQKPRRSASFCSMNPRYGISSMMPMSNLGHSPFDDPDDVGVVVGPERAGRGNRLPPGAARQHRQQVGPVSARDDPLAGGRLPGVRAGIGSM